MPPDRDNLLHILQASERVMDWTQGISQEEFDRDELLRSAAAFQLLIIGEAASQLSAELREAHPEVPWQDIVDFRNVLIHQYFGIDWERVWHTSQTEIGPLRDEVKGILDSLD